MSGQAGERVNAESFEDRTVEVYGMGDTAQHTLALGPGARGEAHGSGDRQGWQHPCS
jgi:hypothetical protein